MPTIPHCRLVVQMIKPKAPDWPEEEMCHNAILFTGCHVGWVKGYQIDPIMANLAVRAKERNKLVMNPIKMSLLQSIPYLKQRVLNLFTLSRSYISECHIILLVVFLSNSSPFLLGK